MYTAIVSYTVTSLCSETDDGVSQETGQSGSSTSSGSTKNKVTGGDVNVMDRYVWVNPVHVNMKWSLLMIVIVLIQREFVSLIDLSLPNKN